MYIAEENCVYFRNPNEEGSRELFVTVHPTKDCARTPTEQAAALARMLNSDASTRFRVVGGA